jgi:hypothetical protein
MPPRIDPSLEELRDQVREDRPPLEDAWGGLRMIREAVEMYGLQTYCRAESTLELSQAKRQWHLSRR